MKAQAPFGGQGGLIEPRQGAASIGQHLANFALSLGVRIKDTHVPPVEQKARGPATADNSTSDDCCNLCHSKPLSNYINFKISLTNRSALHKPQLFAHLCR